MVVEHPGQTGALLAAWGAYLPAELRPAAEAALSVAQKTFVQRRHQLTHGALAALLAEFWGHDRAQMAVIAQVLDTLQVVIDLVDNLADAPLEPELGPIEVRYGVPPAVLFCLPPLLTGISLVWLQQTFGADAAPATRKLLYALGEMAVGQGLGELTPDRADKIAGVQGTLLCLGLWLRPGETAQAEAIELWAAAYGRAAYYHEHWREHPNDADARALFLAAREHVHRLWPTAEFFTQGPLSADVRLGVQPR